MQSRQTERDSAEGERQCSPARRRETVQRERDSAVPPDGERQCRGRETVQSRQTERDSAEGERQCSPPLSPQCRGRETVQSATESAVQRERDSAVRH